MGGGEGEGQGRGRVSGKVLGVSVARIRTKGGLQREAGGGRGSRARATPRLCLLAEEDDERRGGLRWWAGPPAGPEMGGAKLGRFVAPGKLGFSLLFCFFIYCFLFCRFVLNLVLKPIQFILLLTIFLGAKRIKTMLHKIFQNYWTYIYLIVDINPIQIIIALIQMPKLNVSETPKLLVWILPLANISRG